MPSEWFKVGGKYRCAKGATGWSFELGQLHGCVAKLHTDVALFWEHLERTQTHTASIAKRLAITLTRA